MGISSAIVEKKWLIGGHDEVEPAQDANIYFPCAAARARHATKTTTQRRTSENSISVCIPCFNEESSDLEKTIESLNKQALPDGFALDIVVVLDGVEKTSASMRTFVVRETWTTRHICQ